MRALLGGGRALPQASAGGSDPECDLDYELSVSPEQAMAGDWVQVAVDRGRGPERFKVRIPAASRQGLRLRLAGKGRQQGGRSGDLYLTVRIR